MIKEVILNNPIWVIGDVHGEYNLLIDLLEKIPEKDNICFVGDIIDRGKDSKKIIQLIRERNYYCVLGNHEEMALTDFESWLKYGGDATIYSYLKNKDFEKYLENKELVNDLEWLETLPTIIKFKIKKEGLFSRYEKPLYVSHSGLKLFKSDKKILENNSRHEIIWNRSRHKEVGFAVNIHGHSPILTELSNISKSQINIDSGVVYSGNPMFGYLTGIEYPTKRRFYSKTK